MKKLSSNETRRKFLDYFMQQDHMWEPGASLIPVNDPTLLWINSGVAALKKYFDGTIRPANNKIVNIQKSIRTNDIENVGKTARHHTFFEMCGNFSIGAYFKTEAIHYAWEFLTAPQWIGLDTEKIYVTIHTEDDEAFRIWTQEVGLPENRILRSEENFWQIGDGPCGPNTEIYYDRGVAFDPQHVGEKLFFEELENDRYIEVWNIVFSQYDGKEGVDRHLYKELPQKNIDTGMGLERLVCILQEGETNFDTDLFLPIITAIEQQAAVSYKDNPMAYRVIADHIRAITFALADGALFANEGRGYVLRRLLRRAVRYGRQLMLPEGFMASLVAQVVISMNDFYPYLDEKKALIAKLIDQEEQRFSKTLSEGESLLTGVLAQTKGKELAAADVFRLYDTYGFPYELTEEIAHERGFTTDRAAFDQLMDAQANRARAARGDAESMHNQSADLLSFEKESRFVGYTDLVADAEVIGLFQDGVAVDVLSGRGQVIFDKTPFYAESGGQCPDQGTISGEGLNGRIIDVQKAPHKQHLHTVALSEGTLSLGDRVHLVIDREARYQIMAHHSAVHLLQAALLQEVGSHITQAGSYVSESYMRFDFTHYEKLSDDVLQKLERDVNGWIYEHLPVQIEELPIEEARKRNAIALFDEKYGNIVRVVSIGDVSVEFCGGTHVHNTGDLGAFVIVSEESVGSGIRRITGKVAQACYHYLATYKTQVMDATEVLRLRQSTHLVERIEQMQEENRQLSKELNAAQDRFLAQKAVQLKQSFVTRSSLPVLVYHSTEADTATMKGLIEKVCAGMASYLVIARRPHDGKQDLLIAVSPDLQKRGIKAGNLMRTLSSALGGKGGGRPEIAQGGADDLPEAFEKTAEELIQQVVSAS